MSQRAGPLAGVRVIDLTRALAGPYATLMLADAGADVIKIERPGKGDDTRGWGPPFIGEGESRESVYYLAVNRGKRSIELDFADPEQMESLREMIRHADVLAENFRPGVMARLGLDEAALEELNPRLVVLSITGFGEEGPDGSRPGFDQIVQGEAGLMSITGALGGDPTKMGIPIADILAGMFGAFGVVSALQERERSGAGQWVRTSLLAAVVAVHTFQGTRWLLAGDVPKPEGNRHPLIAPYGMFYCRDEPVNVAVGSEPIWRRFAPLVGIDPADPSFDSNQVRVKNREQLEALINAALRTGTAEEWMQRFTDAGIPAGRIRTIDQVYASAQVQHLGLIDTVDHPLLGTLKLPGSPLAYSRSARPAVTPPPILGEHNELRPLPRNAD